MGRKSPPHADGLIALAGAGRFGEMVYTIIETALQRDVTAANDDLSLDDLDIAATDPVVVADLVRQWAAAQAMTLHDDTVDFVTARVMTIAAAMRADTSEQWRQTDDALAGADGTSADATMAALIAGATPTVALGLARLDGAAAFTARWWHALPVETKQQLEAADPGGVGNANGVPAAVRDATNRQRLATRRAALETAEAAGVLSTTAACELVNIRTIAENLAGHTATRDPHTGAAATVQLYVFEPAAFGGDGRAAIAIGDLDSADHVVLNVPGFSSSVAGMVPGAADRLYVEARWAGGGDETVAVVDWMGYDTPNPGRGDLGFLEDADRSTADDLVDLFERLWDGAGVLSPQKAVAGAELLVGDVQGILAMRGDDAPHVTVVGNSYGSTTAAIAATDFGLAADDVVLVGSPGAGTAETAADLSTRRDHTWVASASSDLVTWLGDNGSWNAFDGITGSPLGVDPADRSFGARRVRAESTDRSTPLWPPSKVLDEHGRYFEIGSESLYNIAAIVVDRTDEVLAARPREQEPVFEFDTTGESPLAMTDVDVNAWPREPEGERAPAELSHAPTDRR